MFKKIFLTFLMAMTIIGIANAQSPAPIGFWVTEDGSEQLLIGSNGYCKFYAVNQQMTTKVWGECSWNASSNGGILTIMNQGNYIPAPIYYNIIWVDQQTITVYGDVMHKR